MKKILNSGFLGNVLKVSSSNLLVLILGVMLTFILPMKLSTEGFGYWQLFVLYTSYCGFFILGFSDGVNLRYGGYKYEDLDFKLFRTEFKYLIIYTILVSLAMILTLLWLFSDSPNLFVYIGFAVNITLFNIQGFFIHICQITGKFKQYSIGISLERILLVTFIVFTLVLPINNYEIYICADFIARICVICYFSYNCKEIVFGQRYKLNKVRDEIITNVKVGFFLMFSAIISMMMSNYIKFFIERNFGIKEFSYFAFATSMLSLVLQTIVSISTVLYPMMRRIETKKLKGIYKSLNNILNDISGILLLAYYVAVFFIIYIIPKYSLVLEFLMILFPVILFNIKNNMLITLFYKVFRLEKQIFYNNIIGLGLMMILTSVGFYFNKSIGIVVVAYLLSYFLITIYTERKLFKINNWSNDNRNNMTYIIIIFIAINYFIPTPTNLLIYCPVALIMFGLHAKRILKEVKFLGGLLK